tara:strand:- start:2330 stop:2677 length:348 start_codon:yes stop_codon:yes gene_type:complete
MSNSEKISINQLVLSSDETINGKLAVKLIKKANEQAKTDKPMLDDEKATASGGIFVNATQKSESLISLVKSKLTNVLADNVVVAPNGLESATLCKDNKRVWISFGNSSESSSDEI